MRLKKHSRRFALFGLIFSVTLCLLAVMPHSPARAQATLDQAYVLPQVQPAGLANDSGQIMTSACEGTTLFAGNPVMAQKDALLNGHFVGATTENTENYMATLVDDGLIPACGFVLVCTRPLNKLFSVVIA